MNSPDTLESHNRALFLNCRDNVALSFISDNFTVELQTRLAHFIPLQRTKTPRESSESVSLGNFANTFRLE